MSRVILVRGDNQAMCVIIIDDVRKVQLQV